LTELGLPALKILVLCKEATVKLAIIKLMQVVSVKFLRYQLRSLIILARLGLTKV
jgi:hypothetical protein